MGFPEGAGTGLASLPPLRNGASAPSLQTMLRLPVTLLVFALVAATLGFGVLADTAALFAQVLFAVFLLSWFLALTGESLTTLE